MSTDTIEGTDPGPGAMPRSFGGLVDGAFVDRLSGPGHELWGIGSGPTGDSGTSTEDPDSRIGGAVFQD